MSTPSRNKVRAWVCLTLAAVFAVGFFVYFLLPASKLPAFVPGHQAGNSLHLIQYSLLCAFLAIVSILVALMSADRSHRSS